MSDDYSEFLGTISKKNRKKVRDVLNMDSSIEDRLDNLRVYLTSEQVETCRRLMEGDESSESSESSDSEEEDESDGGNESDAEEASSDHTDSLEQFQIERESYEEKLKEKDLLIKDLERRLWDAKNQNDVLSRIHSTKMSGGDLENAKSPFPFLQTEDDKTVDSIHRAVGKYTKGKAESVDKSIELFLSDTNKGTYGKWKEELISGVPVQLSILPEDIKGVIVDYIDTNFKPRPEVRQRSLEDVISIAFRMLENFKELTNSIPFSSVNKAESVLYSEPFEGYFYETPVRSFVPRNHLSRTMTMPTSRPPPPPPPKK